MGNMGIILWLVVGAIAGWLAGKFVRGAGFGLIGDIIVGIIGAVIAGYLLPLVHFPTTNADRANAIPRALIGAVSLLVVLRPIKPGRQRAAIEHRTSGSATADAD